MKIAVISDTHGDNQYIKNILSIIEDVDLIIHLGDYVKDVDELRKYTKKDIMNVRGNCDFYSFKDSEVIESIENKNFLITHGDEYGVKGGIQNLYMVAKKKNIDVVLYGHTHIAKSEMKDGILFLNPGSTSKPRGGHKSIAIISIEEGNIKEKIINI
jgi:putative phosphoesterase